MLVAARCCVVGSICHSIWMVRASRILHLNAIPAELRRLGVQGELETVRTMKGQRLGSQPCAAWLSS